MSNTAKEWVVESAPVPGTPFKETRIRNVRTEEIQDIIRVDVMKNVNTGEKRYVVVDIPDNKVTYYDGNFKPIEGGTVN